MVLSTRFYVKHKTNTKHTKHMKHFTSILCSMFLGIASLSAQNFQLVYNGTPVTDGETINIKATIEDLTEFMPDYYLVGASTSDVESNLRIHNISDNDLQVNVCGEVLEDIQGTRYSICAFGDCVNLRNSTKADKTGTIPANGTAGTEWHVEFTYGNEGIAKTKLTVTSGEQSQTVFVNFVYGDFATDIKSVASNNVVCKLNNGMLQIESASTLKNYQMYSISGELVAKGALSGYNCNVNVNTHRGIYLVKVTTLEGTKTFKLFF